MASKVPVEDALVIAYVGVIHALSEFEDKDYKTAEQDLIALRNFLKENFYE